MKARKIIFIFLAFVLSQNLWALPQLPQRKITPDNFNRIIRPQAKIILNQFYNLLEKISPEQSELITVKQSVGETQIYWDAWLKNCGELSLDCSEKLTEVYLRLLKIEKLILTLQKRNYSLSRALKSHEIDSRIDLMATLDEMSNQVFLLLQNMTVLLSLPPQPQQNQSGRYLKMGQTLHYIQINAERSFLDGLNDELQPHFDFVWNHYLKDLERYVVVNGKINVFINRVEDFNISWNIFYSKMIGENFTIPPGTKPFIESMHQNWNMILRQI